MQHFDAQQTRAQLSFETLVPALRRAFAEGGTVPLRHNHPIECQGAHGISLIMPAWSEQGYYGLKTVNIFPGNGQRNLPGLHSTYILYDATTGVPLALIDGDEITSRRTAAAAALGADYLARPDARRLLLLGAGRVGSLVPRAMRAVRKIEHVDIWNPNPERAQALIEQLQAEGMSATRIDDLEQAARQADIISCATLSEAPLIHGKWLQPGVHLDLIGSFTPKMKESDPDCFIGNKVFVDTDEAPTKAGDLLDALATGRFHQSDICANLETLCRQQHPGRTQASDITVFKAVGSALEDLTAATLVYQSSR
ncbi:ornithine cyclodeaminase family protein [Kerstersia sp.]|uniref:ornithine cyclodeaminase family protein n=1 Tax=Kerstersia sp. TaxID=1930783 RepID=UPI003F92E9CD